METKSQISAALEANLLEVMPVRPALPPAIFPTPDRESLVSDSEEDYKFSRAKLKSLITKAEDSLDRLIVVADEAEHPRAFEVLAGLLQTTSDMTGKLMDLQKRRKELAHDKGSSDTTRSPETKVAVFIGTTADLQRQLAGEVGNTPDAKSH
jgi:hypothetical protein